MGRLAISLKGWTMRSCFAFAFLMTTVSGAFAASQAPAEPVVSFDCAKATISVEKLICGDSSLSIMDGELSQAYKKALDHSADKQTLIHEQRQWIHDVRNTCADTTCLTLAYADRIQKLRQMSAPVVPTIAAAAGVDAAQLKAFLLKYLKQDPGRYRTASTSLDDGMEPQVFVYLNGRAWCGSGGCTLLLLKQSAGAFEVVDRFTITRLPVYILPSKSNGWRDIAVTVGGGGLAYGTSVLKFDGKAYPSNPVLEPTVSLDTELPGVVILPWTTG